MTTAEQQVEEQAEEQAAELLVFLRTSETKIQEVLLKHLKANSTVCNQHLYIFAVARKALSQSFAFRQLIDSRNGLVAGSLVRMQLDVILRAYALFWVDDPDDFAKRVIINGEQIDRIKASDGEQMKDRYLRKKIISEYPWVDSVYKKTSGYVHLSQLHLHGVFSKGDGEISLHLGPYEQNVSLAHYGELLSIFLRMNMMLEPILDDALLRIHGQCLADFVNK